MPNVQLYISMIIHFLLFIHLSAGCKIINERNDVSCNKGKCSIIRYQISGAKSNYELSSRLISSCDPTKCKNCAHKSDWSLLKIQGVSYVVRNTNSCWSENAKEPKEIFPRKYSKVLDIRCNSYSCWKDIYQVRTNYMKITPQGPCSDDYCKKCYFSDKWNFTKFAGSPILTRKTTLCEASSKIKITDYFLITRPRIKRKVKTGAIIGVSVGIAAGIAIVAFVQILKRCNRERG